MASLEGEIWFFVRDGRRVGPFDRSGLLRELLGLEAPEGALVWRSGLPAWTRASLLDELRRDLPPPLPGDSPLVPPDLEVSDPPMPDLPESAEEPVAAPEERADALSDGDFAGEGADASPPGDENQSRRRRRRRHRHQRTASLPGYTIPLVLLFVAVMVGLWFLLRRMNEVPPGRIILQGALAPSADPALSASPRDATPA